MPENIKCPECGSETIVRIAKKGPNAGQSFYVCTSYPDCKGKVAIEKLKAEKVVRVISTSDINKTAEELYQEGCVAEQAKEYHRALILLKQSLSLEKAADNRMVCRNIMGRVCEKLGDVETAINLYEQNIADECEGNAPYDRLRIIYHRQKRFADEVRVLGKAVKVFEEKVYPGRSDRFPKLDKFRQQLEKAKSTQV